MPIIDLYGRNPDTLRTAFAYPSPLVEDTPLEPGARYFYKPPESNPVFGVECEYAPDAESTVVLRDPSNPRYTGSRDAGRMGNYRAARLGFYPPRPTGEVLLGREFDGIAGISPARVGHGLAGDMGQEDSVVVASVRRARAAFAQDEDAVARSRGEWRGAAWERVEAAGGFYKRQGGAGQAVIIAVIALLGWNVLKKMR